MSIHHLSFSLLCVSFLTLILFTNPSISAVDTFIYGGCSQLKYAPGTPYEYNVNSILSSLVNSASSTPYNTFKISLPGSTKADVVYGLYQCRGDLTTSDCRACVAQAVSRVGVVCPAASGAALQFDGCFIRYDNVTFFGVQDKSVLMRKCGQASGYDSTGSTRLDSLLNYLTTQSQYFRVGGSGSVQGVAQCVQDLSTSQCQDCLAEATAQLKSLCGSAAWGDMFLGKCYARYSDHGDRSRSHDTGEKKKDDNMQRTLAILIAIIAIVALVIICLAKFCHRKDNCEK
ncbi:plasmodesmata-located protein 6 [Daucus carota subsp. sativus]|uniref:plasmodesmata-located protein 6 n=1 Tax=Daucus carota subsp. sativus TaxID=79200 RepID=UPI0007E0CAF7|nr:PREDICTED: cysteine-rich repeat secretory protein 12-like [Daucus carota subsp. sativus]